MGRQFRRQTKLKKKALYHKRRRDRINATIKAAGGTPGKAKPAAPAGKTGAKG